MRFSCQRIRCVFAFLWCSLVVPCGLFDTAIAWAQEGGKAYAKNVYQDLRQQKDVTNEFILVGKDALQYAVPEDGGLRVTFPAKRVATLPVGLQAKFTAVGDFEITGGYELLAADQPTKGASVVGVNLFLTQGPDSKRSVRLGRFSTQQGKVYAVNYTDPLKPKRNFSQRIPTEETRGQIRLVREGDSLSYQVKDGTTDDKFKELYKADFGAEDVTMVRFVVNTSEEPVAVDARLVDLRIRHGGIAVVADREHPLDRDNPNAAGSRGWLAAAVGLGGLTVVLLLMGVGALLFLRRSRADS